VDLDHTRRGQNRSCDLEFGSRCRGGERPLGGACAPAAALLKPKGVFVGGAAQVAVSHELEVDVLVAADRRLHRSKLLAVQ